MMPKIRMITGVAEDEIMINLRHNILVVVNVVIGHLIVNLSCLNKKIEQI